MLPPLNPSVASAACDTKTGACLPPLPSPLPALLKPLRLQLPPVDRYTPRWADCLFWLSQKQGGGWVRTEDVDRLYRSGEELKPLTERRRSYNAKRVTLPTLQLPPLLSPVLQSGQGDCYTSSPTLPPLMAKPSSLQPLQPLRAAGNAPTADGTTTRLPPIAGAAVTLPPLRKV